MLTYSLNYTPSFKTNSEINFICSDNKIHVRLDNFYTEITIEGFEKKLTYLLTYLINYSYLPKVIGVEKESLLIETFLKTSDISAINEAIRKHFNFDNFKGLNLRKNYKKLNCNTFGLTDSNCFPLLYEENITQAGDLNTFLSILNISLDEYLFNDSYSIIIHEVSNKDMNKKFTQKQQRKINKSIQQNSFVELW